ncbi:MAG: flagellin FliC [Deltaproteobacteria bacterium]|nr:MAG: flagellin FliC [Deltaproteobacteria bacterium]
MAVSIVTNTASLGAQRHLSRTQSRMADNINRLASGLRINRASDDAAGLAISEKLKSQIRSLSQASRNANDGVSLTQVAEGAMDQMQGIVSRMRELAIQSANGTLGATERGFIQTEFSELRTELDRISSVTEFNGQKLLDGSASAGLTMQVGINNTANDRVTIKITKLASDTLGSSTKLSAASLSTATKAQAAIAVFDKAISQLSDARAKLGAAQNRLTVTMDNLSVAHENLSAANSRIRDVDVAEETAAFTRNQILSQAGVSVLAQANQLPSVALSLLG